MFSAVKVKRKKSAAQHENAIKDSSDLNSGKVWTLSFKPAYFILRNKNEGGFGLTLKLKGLN